MHAARPPARPHARHAPPFQRPIDDRSTGAAVAVNDPADRAARLTAFRRLAWTAAAVTYGLVALGGVVRVTGSGMGCGDHWPLCHGSLLPPLDPPTLIEYAHRLAASLAGVLVVVLAVLAWTRHRRERRLRSPAAAALGVLVVQVALGAVAVKLRLPPSIVVVHLGVAMLLLALLVAAALRASPAAGAASSRTRWLALVSAGLAFVTVLLGALVANLGAGAACAGFPLCNGALLPAGGALVHLHALHRLAAFALMVALPATAVAAGRDASARRVASWAKAAVGVAAAQILVGAVMVLGDLPPVWRATHMAVGSLLWAVVAGLAVLAAEAGEVGNAPARPSGRSVVAPPLAPRGAASPP